MLIFKMTSFYYCQTPGKVFRLGVDFVLPLSQQEEQEQEEEPLTKIYQKAVYYSYFSWGIG